MSSKQAIVSSTKRSSVYFDSQMVFAAAGVQIDADLIFNRIPPMASIAPVELDITFGPTDEPANDERLEVFLSIVDRNNLPSSRSMRDKAWWKTAQHWIVSGTPATIIQTLKESVIDFFNPRSFTNVDIGDRANEFVLVVAIGTNQAQTSDILVMATLTYIESLIQREFGSDNFTWINADSMLNDLRFEESCDDEMEADDGL